MADETNPITPPAGDQNPPVPPTAPPAPDNGLAARLRIAEKEIEKYKQAEEDRKKAEMTELDRIKAEAEEAKIRASKLERENLITKAASKAGLPSELWNRVQGGTPEEIEADVNALLSFIKPAAPAPANTGTPPQPPAPSAPSSHTAEWQRMKAQDPVAAQQYYVKHREDILRGK